LFAIDNKFENDKWKIDFHLFSEQESKNTTGLSELSSSEKQQLADAGDSIGDQFFSGIQSRIDPLNPIFYLIKDTIINTILFSDILVYNPSKNSENRNVKFTNVGFGNGNYIRSNESTNGTIFQWIAPDEKGNLQGNYEPIVKLLAPTKHQIYNLDATYKISKNSHISSEISMSNFDKNRFSKKDKNDNIGMAIFSEYQTNASLGKSKLWQLNSLISYEFSDKKYKAKFENFINPLWKKIGEGCNLNRNTDKLLVKKGFVAHTSNYFSLGLRINPEVSTVSHDIYNPCAINSRLGITKQNLQKAIKEDDSLFNNIEGLHFHALCEQDSSDLEIVWQKFNEDFSQYFNKLKWLNLGGGHHITKNNYDINLLVKIIKNIKKQYPHLDIYLEPGEAIGWKTGPLVASVLDIVNNGIDIAMLDTSAEAHMSDTIIMPYKADVRHTNDAYEHKYILDRISAKRPDKRSRRFKFPPSVSRA